MARTTEQPGDKILALLGKDSEKAMESIFRQYYGGVCRAIARILPADHVVEDLAQDVFHDLWKRRDSLVIQSSLQAYLRRAGVNKALNYLRDRKIKWDDEAELATTVSTVPDARQHLENQELKELIDRTIDGLPERCRLVFTLSRFEEMTYQEIADHLGLSIKTVENQVSKALRILKVALAPGLKNT
ncbi:MAG: RNA polymerase sigma-70 factor [Saprospiraceae bacterium]